MAVNDTVEVPDYLLSSFCMVQCAFPNGIGADDYYPLLAVLSEEMSFRALAGVVAAVTGKDPLFVYHDALGANSSKRPNAADVARIKQLLTRKHFAFFISHHVFLIVGKIRRTVKLINRFEKLL